VASAKSVRFDCLVDDGLEVDVGEGDDPGASVVGVEPDSPRAKALDQEVNDVAEPVGRDEDRFAPGSTVGLGQGHSRDRHTGGGEVMTASKPKTDAGYRVVPLDPETVDVLRRHREIQQLERMLAGGDVDGRAGLG
jgi:hypothetical protein